MRSLLRLPLHYQILIALVLGTVIGVAVNPGEADLGLQVDGQLAPAEDGILLTETAGDGPPLVAELLADEQALNRRYPELAEEYFAQEPRRDVQFEVTVPRVHIVEDGRSVTMRYSRRHNGQPAVSTFKAASPDEFVRKFPQWRVVYGAHGGGARRKVAAGAKFVGDLFLRLLQMITIPLIVTSLVTGVTGLGTTKRFGRMFGRTLVYYVTTSLLAIATGLVMVNLIRPGEGALLPGGGEPAVGGDASVAGVFRDMAERTIPANPIASLAEGEFLSIITFSILLGIFIIYTGGKSGQVLREFFEAGFHVIMQLTMSIIALAPIGVFAFMLFATSTQGIDIFKSLAWYMLTVFLGLLIHAGITLPLIVKFFGRRSPRQFANDMSPALMTAFSTASSNGTLPLTMTCVEERAGIPNEVSSFVLPLGATVNMDGTALYEAVAVLFISQAYAFADPNFTLTFTQQVLVAVTALLASVGAAGIPHAGLVMMAIVLQAVGLPLDAQGIIIAVDRVLDMCRTTVNVWSDACGCAVLARFEEVGRTSKSAPSPASQSSPVTP